MIIVNYFYFLNFFSFICAFRAVRAPGIGFLVFEDDDYDGVVGNFLVVSL